MPADFIDTNVLVYLASADPAKADAARALLTRPGAVVSVQVLNELANVLRRKLAFDWPDTHAFLEAVRALAAVQPLDEATHRAGLRLAERHRLALYDAFICAAALQAGCERLWSEDMQDGLVIDGGLTIQNPFKPPAPRP